MELIVDREGQVYCGDCTARAYAKEGVRLDSPRVFMWWACSKCGAVSGSLPMPAGYTSAEAVATVEYVMRDGAHGLHPPRLEGSPPHPLPRR